MRKKTVEEFIKQARNIHGDLYNYDKIQYKDTYTSIDILCKRCNQYFTMIPKQHLRGFGCKKCNCKERVCKLTLTKEQFIIKAKKVHDTKYDYNESMYCNCMV